LKHPDKIAFIHYSASPVVGGVEAVMNAHARQFITAGYAVKFVCGSGAADALPEGVELVVIPEIGSLEPMIRQISTRLEQGQIPENFEATKAFLKENLRPVLADSQAWIVHNIFSKHFNLPLTAALAEMVPESKQVICVAWCHDFTWTSSNSHEKVHSGYPWDLLRSLLPGLKYVTISEQRKQELISLVQTQRKLQAVELDQEISVIPSGVDPLGWFSFSPKTWQVVESADLFSGDPIMIMPVRVTQAKNIELAIHVVAELKKLACSPRLVVTGPPDPHSESAMAYYRSLLDLRSRLGVEKEVIFVFETGENENGNILAQEEVAGFLRVSDVMFMPSHREGFGMPVLEAGLLGIPVVSSSAVPAAREIGGSNIYLFEPDTSPELLAHLLIDKVMSNGKYRFRSQVRREFLWKEIFSQRIEPLLVADL
jgi:mannosylglucosylglycerate synthase